MVTGDLERPGDIHSDYYCNIYLHTYSNKPFVAQCASTRRSISRDSTRPPIEEQRNERERANPSCTATHCTPPPPSSSTHDVARPGERAVRQTDNRDCKRSMVSDQRIEGRAVAPPGRIDAPQTCGGAAWQVLHTAGGET